MSSNLESKATFLLRCCLTLGKIEISFCNLETFYVISHAADGRQTPDPEGWVDVSSYIVEHSTVRRIQGLESTGPGGLRCCQACTDS